MTCRAKNANRLVNRYRCDLCKVTGSAIDAERRQPAEMLDVCPTKTDRPAKFRIRDQTKMRQIACREQVRINFHECAKDAFWNHFGAHRAVQKKVHVLRRPRWDLFAIGVRGRVVYGRICAERGCEKDHGCDDQPARFRARCNASQ